MTAAIAQTLTPSPVHHIPLKVPTSAAPVPMKIGMYGAQGVGKTTTTALAAVALSVLHHNKAPVYVVDPDLAWQFPKRRIFDVEGVPLIQRPYRSFSQMEDSIGEAEKMGACCWIVDPLTLIWNELLATFRGKKSFIAIDQWGQLRELWNRYITIFLNSPMHCFALGRLGNDFDEQQESVNGEIKTRLVKVGTKFKAGGGESFGYEPHLLLELSNERKPKMVRGQEREGEGRMTHRADVLKDRTWVLNGNVLRWSDKSSYAPGGFRQVWQSLKPHFDEVQATMARVQILPGTSAALVNDSGDSEFVVARERKTAVAAEIKACLDLYFAGRGKEEVQVRLAVTDLLFGVKSREAAEALGIDKLERGLRILHAYEKIPARDMSSAASVLTQIAECVAEYDAGQSEEYDIPF